LCERHTSSLSVLAPADYTAGFAWFATRLLARKWDEKLLEWNLSAAVGKEFGPIQRKYNDVVPADRTIIEASRELAVA